jgi:hypothetical protein
MLGGRVLSGEHGCGDYFAALEAAHAIARHWLLAFVATVGPSFLGFSVENAVFQVDRLDQMLQVVVA